MTDRPARPRPARLCAAGLLVLLATTGCTGEPEAAVQPVVAVETTASDEPTSGGSGTTPPPASGDEPCDVIDVAALSEIGGVRFDPAEPYEEGPDMADGCFVSTPTGDVSVAIDIRTGHGSLADDVEMVRLQGNEEPEALTVAGGDALYVAGGVSLLEYTGLVTHVGDLLVLVSVTTQGADLSDAQRQDLTVASAEMLAQVL